MLEKRQPVDVGVSRLENTRSSKKRHNIEYIDIFKTLWYSDSMRNYFVHIVDGVEPPEIRAFKIVLLCPPCANYFRSLEKNQRRCVKRRMPAWSYSDIQMCRLEFFEPLDEALVKEMFLKYGGVARNVLNRPYGNFLFFVLYF